MRQIEDEIKDPLKAAHEIQRICYDLDQYIDAMFVLGLGSAEPVDAIRNRIFKLAEIVSDGIVKETHERFLESQQASANILKTALAVSLFKGD